MSPSNEPKTVRGHDSEGRYRDLYESMPVMYFEMDAEGSVVSVNAFGAEQLGYEPKELLGRSVLEVFHEDDRETVKQQFQALLHAEAGVASWEFRKRHKDGSIVWVREAARAVRTHGGQIRVMVVCQDITGRKRAEEERAEAERLVRQLSLQLDEAQERERREIAVHLHDDVGQTLALARIELEELARRRSDAGAGLARIEELILQAIEGTRLLTFELASPVLYDLGLAEALRSLCERQESEDGTRFRFEGPRHALDVPERIAVPLYRIASELAMNVRKHAEARAARIALELRAEHVSLTVEDDGKGFELGARRARPGTRGIGLFSVEQRVDLLGGKLAIRSAPGEGTRVTVRFGLSADEPEA